MDKYSTLQGKKKLKEMISKELSLKILMKLFSKDL